MSFNATSIANFSDSDNERYKAKLARRHAETEALLQEQEEKNGLSIKPKKRRKSWSGKDWRKKRGENRKRKRHSREKRNARGIWLTI